MRVQTLMAATLVVVAGAATACAATSGDTTASDSASSAIASVDPNAVTEGPIQHAAGVTLMAAAEEPSVVLDALLIGNIAVNDRGCVGFSEPGVPGGWSAVQFPYGSSLSADGQTIDVPGAGHLLRAGDLISGAGGVVSKNGVPGNIFETGGVPAECDADSVMVLMDAGSMSVQTDPAWK